MDLTTATPVEIDTVLASLYRAETRLMHDRDTQASYLRSAAGIRLASEQPSRYERETKVVGTTADALAMLKDVVAKGNPESSYSKAADAKRRIDAYQAAVDALAANRAEQAPLHAEYERRGTWTRSFMVLNTNGHAHRDMHCSTCFPTTRYGWLVDLSGSTEEEIVNALGSDACTVCYPTAPVEKRAPRTTFAAEEKEAQAAREEKARLKAEKDAAKAAKALVLDLRPFGVDGYTARIETLAAAKAYLTDSFAWGTGHPYYPAEAVRHVAEAVATKVGTTPEEEVDAARKRYAKRR